MINSRINLPSVVFVGAFPPPLHGMSAINLKILNKVEDVGAVTTYVINLSSAILDRKLTQRLRRLPIILVGIFKFLSVKLNKESSLYISISGGAGQLYELIFICFAKLRKMNIVLHHHSYSYLDKKSLITSLLIVFAGDRAVHVVLADDMGIKLAENYNPRNILILPNSAFVEIPPHKPKSKSILRSLGFISNISEEKGILVFLEIANLLQENNIPVKLSIAGPFQDENIKNLVYEKLSFLRNTEYVGPKYGREKEAFYRSVDVLIFPTMYVNEAAPLVLYEAISFGCPVIAYSKGAIAEIIQDAGIAIPINIDFIETAFDKIKEWAEDSMKFEEISSAAINRFIASHLRAVDDYKNLVKLIVNY